MRFPIILFIIVCCAACSDSYYKEHLFRSWKLESQRGEGAIQQSQLEIDDVEIDFSDHYTYRYNSMNTYEETGNFSVEGTHLITYPRDDQPRYFEIKHISEDSLVLIMQDEGREMIWKFVPQK